MHLGSCDHIVIANLVLVDIYTFEVVITVLSPIFTCIDSFLYLYTCFLFNVCNLLFLFHTKMPWWVLFKVFQKYRFLKSTCHKLSSCKVYQEFVLWKILLYSTSEYELSDLCLLLYPICLLWFCHRLPKGEIVRKYVIQCSEHISAFYVIGWSFNKMSFTCNWVDLGCV